MGPLPPKARGFGISSGGVGPLSKARGFGMSSGGVGPLPSNLVVTLSVEGVV